MINKIHNESCLDTMSRMDDKSIDLCLTDPPYGVSLDYDEYEDTHDAWFELMGKFIPEAIRVSKMVIMPSCKIKWLPWIYQNHPPDWLICWYKGSVGHMGYLGYNDWEPHLVYGKTKNQLHMHDYFQTKPSPRMPKDENKTSKRLVKEKESFSSHPCPKPEDWAQWLIERATEENQIVYDPFTGSGTVPAVAKKMNRQWIGSELSKNYTEMAIKRIDKMPQGQPGMWTKKPKEPVKLTDFV